MLPRFVRKFAHNINPFNIIKWIFHILKNIFLYFKDIKTHFKNLKASFVEMGSFLILFTVFLINLPIVSLLRVGSIPNFVRVLLLKLNRSITMFVAKYDRPDMTRMNRLELFELAFRNMTFKKTRTVITIGGMALGVGAIVFLVSIGYGLQQLVIERVARLDEMRQADVSVQPGSNIKLNDQSVRDFKEIKSVQGVLPLIGVVAKVTYQGSNSDVAVYGVTTDYLKNSAVKTNQGKLFDSNEIGLIGSPTNLARGVTKVQYDVDSGGQVAGARVVRDDVKIGQEIQDIRFSLFPRTWLRVREGPTVSSKVVGYTRRSEGTQYGKEFYGESFTPEDTGKVVQTADGTWVGKWIYSKVNLWEEKDCDVKDDGCEDGKYMPVKDDGGIQKQAQGYFAELEVVVESASFDPAVNNSVLGIVKKKAAQNDAGDVLAAETVAQSSDSANGTLTPSTTGDPALDDQKYLEMVLESSLSQSATPVKKVALSDKAMKEAVVNEAFLKVLGLSGGGSPIGKEFQTSFVVTSNLLDGSAQKLESEPASYKIVGVIPGDNTPFFYVPLVDLKFLGVSAYSQIKIVSETQDALTLIREKIGAMGYITNSVTDTVSQINRLFGTVRVILGLIGAVALGVASLGMFNTLTVSLLERTREVGLMKAMGMTSLEVKRLFLTESMLMGFLGGLLGILSGFLGGKAVSVVLSIFGLMKGAGVIDISYLPGVFVGLVFGLSLFVGLITGYYPAKRATKISALDALRYE